MEGRNVNYKLLSETMKATQNVGQNPSNREVAQYRRTHIDPFPSGKHLLSHEDPPPRSTASDDPALDSLWRKIIPVY